MHIDKLVGCVSAMATRWCNRHNLVLDKLSVHSSSLWWISTNGRVVRTRSLFACSKAVMSSSSKVDLPLTVCQQNNIENTAVTMLNRLW